MTDAALTDQLYRSTFSYSPIDVPTHKLLSAERAMVTVGLHDRIFWRTQPLFYRNTSMSFNYYGVASAKKHSWAC